MAGKGALPKPDHKRARGNKGKSPMRIVYAEPVPQPSLPEVMPNGEPWPVRTVEWWAMWGDDPLAAEFRATDWSELMDTAVVHAEVWSGNTKLANELRLRTQMFGATAEARARLRIQFAAADRADARRERRESARQRYAGLKLVDEGEGLER